MPSTEANRPAPTTADDAPWLNSDQLSDWVALMAMLGTVPAALDAQLKRDAGLNLFEYHILVRLGESSTGRLPMSDLALVSLGTPSRLTHAVTRLETDGFVRRIACTEAGRRTSAVLTEAGRRKLIDTAPGHVREARRLVVDVLTAEQFADLGAAARLVAQVASPEVFSSLTQDRTGR